MFFSKTKKGLRPHLINFLMKWGLTPFLMTLLLSACSNAPKKQIPIESPYTYVDSTVYFSDDNSSLSLRASFSKDSKSPMSSGYQFQFRTIHKKPVFLSSVSIIAGGKRIFIEEGQTVLPTQKSVTFSLPLEASKFVAQYPSALIQFRHNNESFIFAIELHQLKEFTPR